MLNKIIIVFTNYLSWILGRLSLPRTFRKIDDARIVNYHGVGPGSSKCMNYLSDETDLFTFETHIEFLQRNYCLLSLDEITKHIEQNVLHKLEKPPCAITFDDGLSSVFTHAYPILKEKNIPFTVFVNTSVVGNTNLLWLHLLSYLLTTFGVEDTIRSINAFTKDESLHLDIGSSPQEIESFMRANIEYFYKYEVLKNVLHSKGQRVRDVANQEEMYLTWQQIDEMCDQNASVYSHTHSHLPLNAFASQEVIEGEIDTALNILAERDKRWTKYVSFPFGMLVDYGVTAREYALRSAHKYLLEVGNGINSPDRVLNDRIYSRVGLGVTSHKHDDIYAALEIRPLLKHRLKSLLSYMRK